MSVDRDDEAMSCAIAVILACFPGAEVISHFDERVGSRWLSLRGWGSP